MTNYIGNISTIVKYFSMAIAGVFIGLLADFGLNIPVDESALGEVIGAIIFLILAHIDATHPNTIFGENSEDEDDQLVEHTADHINCKCDYEPHEEVTDLDPAGEYEQ